MWKRQHPLTQRSPRQHLIGQQRRGLGHATRTTGGAESALLAAECDELLGVAVLAAQTQQAFFQAAALQVRIELLLDVIRQRPTCFGSKRTKGGIVLLHQPIQQSGFGAMAGVARRVEKRRRTDRPRSGSCGHGRRPCIGRGRNRLWRDRLGRTAHS
jgi:hypothetical protein